MSAPKFMLAGCAALAFASVPANATVINFDEFTTADYNLVSVNSGGFHFEPTSPLGTWGATSGYNMDFGGGTLFHNYASTITTVTRIGGGSFDFNSLDLGDVYNNGSSGDIFLTFTDGLGTTSQTVTLDNAVGGQTFTFNRLGLSSFTLHGLTTEGGGWLQFDNLVVDNTTSGAVPETATWAMMILGMGMIGAAMRRRQSVRVTYA